MPLTSLEFYRELINSVPKLSPFLAKRFVNRALHDIYDSRQWSFLKSEGTLYSPAVITSGSFSVTINSNIVTANATSITALNNLSNPLLTKRQIRFGSGATPIYNISIVDSSFSSNGILYLDRPYREATNTNITYRCYRCYYGPPEVTIITQDNAGVVTSTTAETTDFLRFNDIYNPTNSRWFVLPIKLRELLDMRDPQRSVSGIPYYLFAYKSINGIPQFEMWPHPQASIAYPCSYQRRGIDFVTDSNTLPIAVPDELLMERALFYACEWAAKNQSRYTELKGVNWRLEQAAHKMTYSNRASRNPGLLEQAHINDEESYPQQIIMVNKHSDSFPLGTDDLSVLPFINA